VGEKPTLTTIGVQRLVVRKSRWQQQSRPEPRPGCNYWRG